MQQLADEGGGGGDETAKRIRALEKEVHYYKKLCKELRSRREDGDRDEPHGGSRRHDPKSPERTHRSSDRSPYRGHKSPDRGHKSSDRGLASPYREQRSRGHGVSSREAAREYDNAARHHRKGAEETPRRGLVRQQEAEEERIDVARGEEEEEEEEGPSDNESAVSQIQPSHIAQFQRRLARLHR